MKQAGPPGDYYEYEGKGDRRVKVVTFKDGRKFRECLGPELDPAKLDPEQLVWLGKEGRPPRPAGEFADLVFPGGHPFLHGLCLIGMPVYLEVREDTE